MADLCVALDSPSEGKARQLIESLRRAAVPQDRLVLKVGLELFIATGPGFVRELTGKDLRVFLDLKLHDIPNTVAQATLRAAELGVEFLTLHLANGRSVFELVDARLKAEVSSLMKPKILGVSVLTSFSDDSWSEHVKCVSGEASATPFQSVERLLAHASTWSGARLDGIVCSPRELELVRRFNNLNSKKWLAVIPGIRPAGQESHDQVRVLTPREAVEKGADLLVVGRPITEAADPGIAAEKIFQEIEK